MNAHSAFHDICNCKVHAYLHLKIIEIRVLSVDSAV